MYRNCGNANIFSNSAKQDMSILSLLIRLPSNANDVPNADFGTVFLFCAARFRNTPLAASNGKFPMRLLSEPGKIFCNKHGGIEYRPYLYFRAEGGERAFDSLYTNSTTVYFTRYERDNLGFFAGWQCCAFTGFQSKANNFEIFVIA